MSDSVVRLNNTFRSVNMLTSNGFYLGLKQMTLSLTLLVLASLVCLATFSSPANAVAYVPISDPYGIQPTNYVSGRSPEIGCYSTSIALSPVTIYALPGFGAQRVLVYATVQYWTGKAWGTYSVAGVNFSLADGGIGKPVQPNGSVYFSGRYIPVSANYYMNAWENVEWWTPDFKTKLGAVRIVPTNQLDYTGKYTYAGLYCAAGPWAR
jgi:hypothetical protein